MIKKYKSLYELYESLISVRTPYVERGRFCALLTSPSFFDEDHNQEYDFPFQSVGARGVAKVTTKCMNALFPARPFVTFSYSGDPLPEEEEVQLKISLSELQQKLKDYFEELGIRYIIERLIKQIIVTGNCVLFFGEEIKVFPLNTFVVKRRNDGSILSLVVKETVYQEELAELGIDQDKEEINLYIGALWDNEKQKYHVLQETEEGQLLWESWYQKEKLPFLCVQFEDHEDYSNSYVWGIIADLKNLESLSKGLIEIAEGMSKYLIFLDQTAPLGQRISPEDVSEAKAGSVLLGNAQTLTSFQCYQGVDIRAIWNQYEILLRSVREYFTDDDASLLGGRDRVTATEINALSERANTTLAGLYSRLSYSLQIPLMNLILARMEEEGKVGNLKKLKIKPYVVESVGNLIQSNEFVQAIASLPEPALRQVNWQEFTLRFLTLRGISVEGLIYTPEQMSEIMTNEGLQKAAPELVNTLLK